MIGYTDNGYRLWSTSKCKLELGENSRTIKNSHLKSIKICDMEENKLAGNKSDEDLYNHEETKETTKDQGIELMRSTRIKKISSHLEE